MVNHTKIPKVDLYNLKEINKPNQTQNENEKYNQASKQASTQAS